MRLNTAQPKLNCSTFEKNYRAFLYPEETNETMEMALQMTVGTQKFNVDRFRISFLDYEYPTFVGTILRPGPVLIMG